MRDEAIFQQQLKKEIKTLLPGAIVLKNDPIDIQGIPDLTVLYQDKYAILEVKRSANAPYRPNQEWYLAKFAEHTYSATIYPENKEEVLNELQRSLQSS